MKKIITLVMLIALTGCAGSTIKSPPPGNFVEITEANNEIIMPSYSFTIPPDDGWELAKGDPAGEELFLSNIITNMVEFKIRFIRAPIPKEMSRESAINIADNYRNNEKNVMTLDSVAKRTYELNNVKMEEDTLGDKKFYIMTYNILSKDFNQAARLYLYFPKEYGNEYFLLALYTESVRNNIVMAYKSKEDDFKNILKNLSLTKKGE